MFRESIIDIPASLFAPWPEKHFAKFLSLFQHDKSLWWWSIFAL